MLIAAAPLRWYSNGTLTAVAASFIQPFDGERRLNSAIMPVAERINAELSDGKRSSPRRSTSARKKPFRQHFFHSFHLNAFA